MIQVPSVIRQNLSKSREILPAAAPLRSSRRLQTRRGLAVAFVFIACLHTFGAIETSAWEVRVFGEGDRSLSWYPDRSRIPNLAPTADGAAVTGTLRFIVQEDRYPSNTSLSRISSWCIYLNGSPLPWTWSDAPFSPAAYINYYPANQPSDVAMGQDALGCWNTRAIEKPQESRSQTISNGFDIEVSTSTWPNGSATFKIVATTELGYQFSKSVSLVVSNPTTTIPTTTIGAVPGSTASQGSTSAAIPSSTTSARANSSTATAAPKGAPLPTSVARVGSWIESPFITKVKAKWSDSRTALQFKVPVGGANQIVVKYGVESAGSFKSKKIRLAEGINFFPGTNHAEFSLTGLLPDKAYRGSLSAIGPSGKSGLVTFKSRTSSIPSRPVAAKPTSPKGGSGSSSSGSSSGGTSGGSSSGGSSSQRSVPNVVGWNLSRAIAALENAGYVADYFESAACPDQTWFGIVNTSNWTVVGQSGGRLAACKD